MTRKIMVSLLVIAVTAMLVGLGTFAQFSDTATSSGNTFTAGTLDIGLGSGSWSGGFSYDNMRPGETVTFTIVVSSGGSLPLDYDVTTALSGDLAAGANPTVVSDVRIDGVSTTSDSLSEAGGADASDSIEIDITMPLAAGNEYQGDNGALDVTIDAIQQ